MALAIDGTAHANSSSSSDTVTLTTTGAGLVVVVVLGNSTGGVTGVTSSNLTFSEYAVSTTVSDFVLEMWTAESGSALTSEVITVNLASSGFLTIDAFGVSDYDTGNIFDDNASIPVTVIDGDAETPGEEADPISISTDALDTMIIGAFRFQGTASPTAGSGYTAVSGADYLLTEYQIVSSAQSSLTVDVGTGSGDSNGAIATAIRESGTTTGQSPVPIILSMDPFNGGAAL